MQKPAKKNVELYLRESILALVPTYKGDKHFTTVHTIHNTHTDFRRLSWLVSRLAHYYSLDLTELRRRSAVLLDLKHHISLPISRDLVLLPIRLRQAKIPGETTTGYVNLLQLKKVGPIENHPPYRSYLAFHNQFTLYSLHHRTTLTERLRQGKAVLQDLLDRQERDIPRIGLRCEDVANILPNCQCLLRDIALNCLAYGKKNS